MVLTQSPSEVVHPDTQAVLLLCGGFATASESGVRPLSLHEYNSLALWLKQQGRRPADLTRLQDDLLPALAPGLPDAGRLRTLLDRGVPMAAALERWQRLGLWVISRGEERYPRRLLQQLRNAAPALLYGAGDVTRLAEGGLAVVGSRDIDEEGLAFTRRVAGRCAADRVQVISGGARGVDQAAVSAALEAGGGAVAVVADRLDRTATGRDAKEPLRRGLLTLVSPYEPELGFTVGRAMGRNKHIYALADHALIVRFTVEAGGTWAGAVEHLGRLHSGLTSVPVFVRVANNPEDGWHALQRRGALAFPEAEFWANNVAEVLNRGTASPPDLAQGGPPAGPTVVQAGLDENATAAADPAASADSSARPGPGPAPSPLASGRPSQVLVPATADTCYSRCLPLLLQCLRQEPIKKDLGAVAKQLEITSQQLNEWLKRAIGEGAVKIVKKGRRQVYTDASLPEKGSLFDRGGDAA